MILITGANRGIGAALMARLPEAQGTSRSGADGMLMLDVTDPASVRGLSKSLGDAPLDMLVCNAGVYPDKDVGMDEITPEMWGAALSTNVTGVFLTVQALLPNLRAARGKVAIISSAMGSSTRAKGTGIVYRVSKAAVTNLGLNLATALRPDGIAVGMYHPGWVVTDMGGAEADINVETSSEGLVTRFDALTLDRSGCFESYDGTPIPI